MEATQANRALLDSDRPHVKSRSAIRTFGAGSVRWNPATQDAPMNRVPAPLQRERTRPRRGAVLFCGHGSRDAGALSECRELTASVQQQLRGRACATGFLSLGQPEFGTALRELIVRGATEVTVAPLLLAAGGHQRQDIPRLVEQARAQGALDGVTVRVADALGLHPGMFDAARSRIEEAQSSPYARTWLLCVGSGSEVADANDVVGTVASRLVAELGFGGGGAAFVSGAAAKLPEALEAARAGGFESVLLLPYFLFPGRLLRRGSQQANDLARALRIHLLEAKHLGNHRGVVEAVLARIAEAETEDTIPS